MSASSPEQVTEEFIRYFNAGDLDGLVRSLYEDGIAITPTPGAPAVTGRAAAREAIKGFLDLGGKMVVEASAILQNGDIALSHVRWRLDIPGKDSIGGVTAEVLRRQPDGTWRYAIDNPFGSSYLTEPQSR